jgi:autotransporter-associated beta strand protein
MKRPISSRNKAFLAVQAALALMIVTTPMTALGKKVDDSNASNYLYNGSNSTYGGNAYTIQNPSSVVFATGSGYFGFDSSISSIIIGDINGSDNTVTLSNNLGGYHVIGELRDVAGDPANEWAEGNTVTLSGSTGNYVDAAGGVATGRASAGRNTVNLSGSVDISSAVFGGLATGDGNAVNNKVNITGGGANQRRGEEIHGGYSAEGQANENEVHVGSTAYFARIETINGGHAGSSANNNRVIIDGGTFLNIDEGISIAGAEIENAGSAANSVSTGNTVTIKGGSFSAYEINVEGVYGDGSASDNHVTIESGSFKITATAADPGSDLNYDINITGATTRNGDATNNTVDISGGTFTTGPFDPSTTTEDSSVSIAGGVVLEGNGDATGNIVNLSGSVGLSGDNVEIYGGVAGGTGSATGNTINVGGRVTLTGAKLYGGYTEGSGDAFTGNALVLKSGWSGAVGSAQDFARIVFENGGGLTGGNVTVGSGSAVTEINVTGGATLGAKLSGTGFVKTGEGTLTLSNESNDHLATTVSGGTLAIASDKPLGTEDANNTLAGGTLKLTGASYSYSWNIAKDTSNTIKNTTAVTLGGDYIFSHDDLEEGWQSWLIFDASDCTPKSGDDCSFTVTGKIRNDSGGNVTVEPKAHVKLTKEDVDQSYGYSYTGMTLVGEGGILELAKSVTLANKQLTLERGATFNRNGGNHSLVGGTLNVIDYATYQGDLEAEGAKLNFTLTGDYGSSASGYILTVNGVAQLKGAKLDVNIGENSSVTPDTLKLLSSDYADDLDVTIHDGSLEIHAKWTSGGGLIATSFDAGQSAKAYAEGFLGGAAALAGASDNAAKGVSSAAQSLAAGGALGMAGFTEVGGGSLKYKTGSHVDVDGYNLVAGLASGKDFAAGQLTVGAFVEYGEGDYSSYNSFASGRVKGQGDTDYAGGGALARFAFADGFYLDGTLRVGKVHSDFRSTQIGDTLTTYDTSSRYYGAHVGIGKVWKLGKNSLDIAAQYLWTHQKGDKARIKGRMEELEFDDVNSSRARLAARYNHALNASIVGYVGAGWEKEFDGKADAKLTNLKYRVTDKLQSPELKGDSGLVELGLSTAPFAKTPLTVDVGLQGYWGQREGVTGGVKVNYRF